MLQIHLSLVSTVYHCYAAPKLRKALDVSFTSLDLIFTLKKPVIRFVEGSVLKAHNFTPDSPLFTGIVAYESWSDTSTEAPNFYNSTFLQYQYLQ